MTQGPAAGEPGTGNKLGSKHIRHTGGIDSCGADEPEAA